MLQSLQILRALAVIQVIFVHMGSSYIENLSLNIPLFTDFGWLGVRLFFVISGYIIARTIVVESNLVTFLFKRYFRIFPTYFIVTAGCIILAVVIQKHPFSMLRNDVGVIFELGEMNEIIWYVKSLLIIPQDVWPILGIGWSLEHELLFYGLFGISFFAVKSNLSFAVIILCGLTLLGLTTDSMIGDHIALSFPYFIAGILCYSVVEKKWRYTTHVAALVAVPAFIVMVHALYGVGHKGNVWFDVSTPVFFGALMLVSINLERFIPNNSITRIVVEVGNASFSIYLFHLVGLKISRKIVELFFTVSDPSAIPQIGLVLLYFLAAMITIGASYLGYRLIELPLHNKTRYLAKKLPG